MIEIVVNGHLVFHARREDVPDEQGWNTVSLQSKRRLSLPLANSRASFNDNSRSPR